MARKLAFIPTTTVSGLIPLEDIPDDVKAEVDEAYKAIASKDGRIRAEFDTVDELKQYAREVASYCAQHEPVLRFRKSPTRNLPDTVMDFRVTLDVEANGANRDGNGETRPANAR